MVEGKLSSIECCLVEYENRVKKILPILLLVSHPRQGQSPDTSIERNRSAVISDQLEALTKRVDELQTAFVA